LADPVINFPRLPQMTNQDDLSALLPCNWRPATAAACAEVA